MCSTDINRLILYNEWNNLSELNLTIDDVIYNNKTLTVYESRAAGSGTVRTDVVSIVILTTDIGGKVASPDNVSKVDVNKLPTPRSRDVGNIVTVSYRSVVDMATSFISRQISETINQ